jgi:hypothetical protein
MPSCRTDLLAPQNKGYYDEREKASYDIYRALHYAKERDRPASRRHLQIPTPWWTPRKRAGTCRWLKEDESLSGNDFIAEFRLRFDLSMTGRCPGSTEHSFATRIVTPT